MVEDKYKELIHDDMKANDYQLLGIAILSDKWFRFKQRFKRKKKVKNEQETKT